MRGLRKTTIWLGLIGSVSLLSLAVQADEGVQGAASDRLQPVLMEEAAEPSFHDVAIDRAPAQNAARTDNIPLPEPAPVTITAGDLKPADGLDIPLPDPAVMALTPSDWLRVAVEKRLADDAAMRDLRLDRRDRDALSAFYMQAGRPALWVQDSAWSRSALAVMGRLKAAGEEGLDPVDYPLPDGALNKASTPAQWAEADLKLSVSIIRYARDARGGRIDPSRLSALVTPKLDIPDIAAVLAAVASSKDAGAALASFNPQHRGYQGLKAQLARLRESHPTQPSLHVPKGPSLRVGMKDPRVPLIRARFNLAKDDHDQSVYDERVASAVAGFQKEKGLPTNGVLTPQTVAALSGPSVAQREADLIANMERWRWLPADLGARHIFVNVPEFRLRLVERGDMVHQTKVIVGKPETPTPLFSDEMETVIVNPSWTVPPSIMKKEFLPALARDPYYAERKGFRVIRRGDSISVQQPPGERNALGFIKFIFPNQHAVYLHDTPSRGLFGAERRAFSHGCVRVDQPFRLAEEVLGRGGTWSESKLRGLVGRGERHVRLQQPLPVHLTYFTLAVDEHGHLKSFEDLYGFHGKVRAALGLQG